MPERRNRWLRTLQGAALLCAVWAGGMPDADARVALVVGNSAYQHTDPLDNPSNDAEDMARQLRQLGFEVIEGRNLTEDGFYDHLRKFSEALHRTKGGEAALFFYAGHGIQNDESENYLVPVDVALEDKWSMRDMVRLDDVMETMEEFSGLKLVFLDACRDNPLRGKSRSMGGRGKRGLAPVTVRDGGAVGESSGTVIVYATAPDDTADDGDGRNSPFTGALLEHVGTPGLEVDEMLDRVTGTVIERTRHTGKPQVPWVSKSKSGQFYFLPGSGRVVAGDSGTTGAATTSSSEARATHELQRRAAVEDAYWEICEKGDSAVYCEDYLAEFEDGAYVRMAKRRLAEVRQAVQRAEAKRQAEEEARRRAAAEAKRKEEAADPSNLFAAVWAGDVERVKTLLGAGADANARSKAKKHGNARPLHWAASAGNVGVISALLGAGADPNAATDSGWTPLHSAAWKNRANAIKALLAGGADPNAKDNGGTTVLRRAVIEGHAEAVKALLAGGADGTSMLHRMALDGNVEGINMLLAGGANPNGWDDEGVAPLHRVVIEGDVEAIRALLAGGADVNVKTDGNFTPLHTAARHGHFEAIKTLVAAGADVNAGDEYGTTPLHRAAWYDQTDAIEALVAAGADVNAGDEDGETPLHYAADEGQVEAAEALLAGGARVNARNRNDETPLQNAVSRDHTAVARVLRRAGGRT